MTCINEVRIIGNVTRDAELKTVNIEGVPTPRCRFTVAVDRNRANGESVTQYFEVAAWYDYATKIAPWLMKGRRVYVEGQVGLHQYNTANGEPRASLQIYNPTVVFLDRQPQVNTTKIEEPNSTDELPFC